ncbi:hypothetical protein HDU83_003070 [Entophlyctis luteolus]|nr:hypothetical protein HDU83_003070 [Entophlyctis luteolus]
MSSLHVSTGDIPSLVAPNASPTRSKSSSTATYRDRALARKANRLTMMSRMSVRIVNFIQCYAKVGDVTFPIVIERSKTIQELADLVMAEHMFNKINKTCGTTDKARFLEEVEKANPIVIAQVYSPGFLALSFDDVIENVIEFNDILTVAYFDQESLEDVLPTKREGSIYDRPVPTLETELLVPTSTFDDSLAGLLSNKQAIVQLQAFALAEYAVENLLLHLEIEALQSCPVESVSICCRYIHAMYVDAVRAPIPVIMPLETRNAIRVRVEAGNALDETLFDSVQEQVLATLQTVVYPRFMKSAYWSQLDEARRADPKSYFDAQIHSFASAYPLDLQFLRDTTLIVYSPTSRPAIALLEELSPTTLTNTPNEWREVLLAAALRRYGCDARGVFGYFDNTVRGNWAVKQRRITKEKKLNKFFGSRVGEDAMRMQKVLVSSDGILSLDKSNNRSWKHNGMAGMGIGIINISDVMQVIEDLDENDDVALRRKKIDKLRNIFGDPVPTQPDGDSETSNSQVVLAEPTIETTNELSADARRMLNKRTKKLAGMLGETVDARLVGVAAVAKDVAAFADGEADAALETPLMEFFDSSQDPAAEEDDSSVDMTDDSAVSKEARKRRLDKLSQLLGERITNYDASADAASLAKIQTFRQKVDVRRKTSNIEARIGRLLTPQEKATVAMKMKKIDAGDILKELDDEEKSVQPMDDAGERLYNLVTNLSQIIQNTDGIEDFLELVSYVLSEITGKNRDPARGSVSMSDLALLRKQRITKLFKFFKLSSVTIYDYIDTQIIRVLEFQIKILVTDGAELDVLKDEILTLRGILNSRSPAFQEQLQVESDKKFDGQEAKSPVFPRNFNKILQGNKDATLDVKSSAFYRPRSAENKK